MANTNQTIKKLSEFKDAAQFERLATAYLRASKPHKYLNTSHLGVNPKGSTVRAPLDGFSTYEENGELGIAGLEHTTTQINNLHNKFLLDLSTVKPKDPSKGATGTEGDLRKAIDVIKTFRAKYLDIKKATIALVSTLDLKPETILEAKALAKSNNIDLEIHGGTRIANYLDTTAKGQYLRKQYLDENPDKLSLELLRDITKKQIENYSKFTDTQTVVQRKHHSEVSHHKFLVGESGVGKSIIASGLLQANFENGSAGIFLSDKIIDESSSLEEAITKQLVLLENQLDNDAGSMALELCPIHLPFIIVVEDVNSSDNPIKNLQKILKWIPKEQSVKWRLICPVYPNYISSLKHDEKEKISDIIEYVGNYSIEEAIEAVRLKADMNRLDLSEVEMKSISESLGCDPLLIALSDLNAEIDPSDIIENYIDNDIGKVAACFENTYDSEIKDLYSELLSHMLINRNFNPIIKEIGVWFKDFPTSFNILKKSLKQGSTIYISNKNRQDTLSFRHDRISLAMASNVIIDALNYPDDFEYLRDPFYSEAIAVALVKKGLEQNSIDYLLRNNPLSLFYAFMQVSQDRSMDITYLIDKIKVWINQTNKDELANQSIRFEAVILLSRIDSESVIPLTDLFINNSLNEYWLEARFRNGDLKAGLNLFLGYELGLTITGRKELLSHVFSRFGDVYSQQLSNLLRSKDNCDSTLKAILLFTGYLGNDSLEKSIKECWTKSKDKKHNLLSFMWAAARCHKKDEALLTEICDEWASLPNEEDDRGITDLNSFACYGLDLAFESYVPVNAVAFFIKKASEDERLKWPITYMCRVFVDPVSIQHVVEFLAKHYEKSEQNFYFTASKFAGHLNRKNEMADESKVLLEKIINDEEYSQSMAEAASKLYGAVEARTDLQFLRSFEKQDRMFEWAIFERAKRGDLSAASSIIELLSKNQQYWWQAGRYIWNEAFTTYLSKTINEIKVESDKEVDYILSELLMELDQETSSKILLDNWISIKNRKCFVHAAIYTANPKLLELVHEEVRHSNEKKELFRHVLMIFGENVKGRKGITRLAQIKALWRYESYLSDHDIYSIWTACNKNKYFQFRKSHVDNIVSKTKYLSTIVIDFDTLDKAYKDKDEFDQYWFELNKWYEEHIESGFEHSELVSVIIKWFETKKDINSFDIVSQIATKMFTRNDMLKLRSVSVGLDEIEKPYQDLEFYIKLRSLY
jgi:hypothetical protein